MKRKIIAICVVVAMLAVAIIGGTMAYFTDTDEAVNVMTMGNVKIVQNEQKRGANGLVDFEDAAVHLVPGVYENLNDTDGDGYWDAVNNSVDKIVSVTNTGKSGAYVRTWLAFEKTDATIHKNFTVNADNTLEWIGSADIDGQTYEIAVYTYGKILEAGKTTAPSLIEFVIDKTVDNKDVASVGNTYEILAFSQAVQEAGFTGAKAALDEAFGEATVANMPWEAGVAIENVVTVDDAAGLMAAFDAAVADVPTKIELSDDVTLADGEVLTVPAGATVVLDLGDNEIVGTSNRSVGHVLKNEGTLEINGGTIKSTAANGGSAIMNSGDITVNGTELYGAPFGAEGNPSYAVNNIGTMELNDVEITADHGAVASYSAGAVATLNNCDIEAGLNGITNAAIYTYDSGKVVVNSGTYANKATDQNSTGASVINGFVEVNSGNFTGRIENYFGTPVINGGTFSVKPKAAWIASGYSALDNGDGTYTVGISASSAADISEAVANGVDEIILTSGTYVLPNLQGETLTVKGDESVIIDITGMSANGNQGYAGADLVFDGVTVEGYTSNYKGIYHANSVTYRNCTLTKLQFLFAHDVVFENCKFDSQGTEHSIWTYGAENVSFIECDFTYTDRCVNVYIDPNGDNTPKDMKQVVTFTDCTFTTSNSGSAGAVEINSSNFAQGAVVTLEGCTAPANGEIAYVSPWDSTNGAGTTLTIK